MSSANPKVQEPSMEEILASIRRIIADDQEVLRASERMGATPLKNVLDLTERQTSQMLTRSRDEVDEGGPSRQPDFQGHADFNELSDNDLHLDSYEDEVDEIEAQEQRLAEPAFADPRRDDTLLSSAANASVADAFTRLGSTIMPAHPVTLEDLMKDMLRPMLKAWLDENLPGLVERLVQAEITRIARSKR